MPDGGTLRVFVSWESRGPPELRSQAAAQIAVSDVGVGMTPDQLSRAFEPFFTTKADSENSGLGLAIVHGIVKDHGGVVRVESSPGRGSTFRVFLPAIPVPEASDAGLAWRGEGALVVL
jgi:signal transduction histidine kinase